MNGQNRPLIKPKRRLVRTERAPRMLKLISLCLFPRAEVIHEAGGHRLRKLQDDSHHALAEEPQRGASVQCVRALLQTPQRETNRHL